jgi:metal-responsive CopG/Arc/MetJ family transcriptional regulator
MKTKNLTFCIPKEIVQEFDIISKKTMIPKSKIVSKLLEEYIEKYKFLNLK